MNVVRNNSVGKNRAKKLDKYVMRTLEDIMQKFRVTHMALLHLILNRLRQSKRRKLQTVLPYSILNRIPRQIDHLNRLVGVTDTVCLVNFRMDRNAFGRLCRLFRELRVLRERRFLRIEEQVAIFLGVLAHHKKNRIVRFDFMRSGDTVSRYVLEVMEAVLKLHCMFVVKPEPIKEGCVDSFFDWRWKHFKARIPICHLFGCIFEYKFDNAAHIIIWSS